MDAGGGLQASRSLRTCIGFSIPIISTSLIRFKSPTVSTPMESNFSINNLQLSIDRFGRTSRIHFSILSLSIFRKSSNRYSYTSAVSCKTARSVFQVKLSQTIKIKYSQTAKISQLYDLMKLVCINKNLSPKNIQNACWLKSRKFAKICKHNCVKKHAKIAKYVKTLCCV